MSHGPERAVLISMSARDLRPTLPRRRYLGFGVDACPAPPELAHEGPERWIVSEIDSMSPAHLSDPSGGLQMGDDLIAINGVRVLSLAQLRMLAAKVAPRSTCIVRVLRGGELLDIALPVQTMPLETLSAGRIELDQLDWLYKSDSFRLRAIWTQPAQPKNIAVWLLPSAAWITQESPLDPLEPTFQLIDYFTSHGISTLRIDRSGLGDSEGPHPSAVDLNAELSMWQAGLRYFLSRSAGQRRCLFGRSLGGILAPLVAKQQPIDAICVWGTSSLNWHEASLESVRHQRILHGQSGEALERVMRSVEQLQQLVYLAGLTPAAARLAHPELTNVSVHEYQNDLVHDRTHLFFHQLQQQDLPGAWTGFRGDLLAVHAQYDTIVPEIALRRLVQSASGRSQFVSLPGIDHFMHERASLEEAVAIPWGGKFSQAAAQCLTQFFLDAAPASI